MTGRTSFLVPFEIENETKKPRHRHRRCIIIAVVLACFVAVSSAVAAIVVLTTRTHKNQSSEEVAEFSASLVITNKNFTDDMRNHSSTDYINFQKEFCNMMQKMIDKAGNNEKAGQYQNCTVVNLSNIMMFMTGTGMKGFKTGNDRVPVIKQWIH
ncbi:uncharacterized protein LOC112555492 [Pomacea canaliculata]|uniref:uncharacterized protein LOC112555492 n=1 Tax=Pomacea canaliculata TaxID=400727 RepID=UPI000D725656|nr:uncharacterized protein LOC112555492 [Pomacea canaliculata]